jgi:hypothetical protein
MPGFFRARFDAKSLIFQGAGGSFQLARRLLSTAQEAIVTTKKKGRGKSSGRKLKVKKETLRDLDAKGKVAGGVILVQEKYTDAYDCTMATCATFCPQQPCQTGNMFCHMVK